MEKAIRIRASNYVSAVAVLSYRALNLLQPIRLAKSIRRAVSRLPARSALLPSAEIPAGDPRPCNPLTKHLKN